LVTNSFLNTVGYKYLDLL